MKLLTFFLLAASMFAQEPVTRVFEFLPEDGEKMQKISAMFSNNSRRVLVEPALGLIVMTGPEAQVAEVETFLRKYYKPKALEGGISGSPNRNIELVTQILYARSEGNESNYPATLQPIVQQLKQLTQLNSFSVMETHVLRVRNGGDFSSNGTLPFPGYAESPVPTYELNGNLRISGLKIQANRLHFYARVPFVVGLKTAVDLKPGQATVIGKTNASTKDGSIILILTARLVD